MSTVITDHGVVGENSSTGNSVSVTLTSDVPKGTRDDPNYLIAIIAYEGDIGPLDGSNGFNNSTYIVTMTDSGTRNENPYFGLDNEYIYQPNRWSVRAPAGNLGLTTPNAYIILQSLDAGDTVNVTLTRSYGNPQPTWIGVRLHYWTGLNGRDPLGPIEFFTGHNGPGDYTTYGFLTFPNVVSPGTTGGLTYDHDVFKYRSSIHEPDEAVTWTQPHPSLPEQYHFSRGGYRASYRFDQPEVLTSNETLSFPSAGSHLIYFGAYGMAPGIGYEYSPPEPPANIPGLYAVRHNGQWHLMPGQQI